MAGMDLRPYQSEAKAAVFEQWETIDRTLLVLPTGCGKTIVFAKVAEEEHRTHERCRESGEYLPWQLVPDRCRVSAVDAERKEAVPISRGSFWHDHH